MLIPVLVGSLFFMKMNLERKCLYSTGIADVVLTAENMLKYGIDVEANPLIHLIAENVHYLPALILTKVFATSCLEYLLEKKPKVGSSLSYFASTVWGTGAGLNLYLYLQ